MGAATQDKQRHGIELLFLLAISACLLVAVKMYCGAMQRINSDVVCVEEMNLVPMPFGSAVPSRGDYTAPLPNGVQSPEQMPGKKFDKIISKVSAKQGVDPHLVKAVIKAESNFHVRATSDRGAKGLMQLMPETARAMGAKNPYDPRQNIRAGVKYLAWLLRLFNDHVRLALAAYNAGPGVVERHGGVPPYGETRTFVRKVLRYYAYLQSISG